MYIVIVIGLLTLILTNIANNVAIAFIMTNILIVLYQGGLEFNILIAVYMVICMSVMAIVTPAASIMGAMFHSSKWATPTSIYKWSTLTCLLSFLVVLIAVPLINILS